MWSLICSMVLVGLPASTPDSLPVWTIAADGSMVQLFAVAEVPEVIQEVTVVIEEPHPHNPGPVTELDLPKPGSRLILSM